MENKQEQTWGEFLDELNGPDGGVEGINPHDLVENIVEQLMDGFEEYCDGKTVHIEFPMLLH